MGNNSSAKKVTIENDGDQIHLSPRAAEKIRKEMKGAPLDEDDDEDRRERKRYGSKAAIEEELQKNNNYWKDRISRMKQGHEKMNKIMEEEYLKASDEMERTLPRGPTDNATPPCQDKKKIILSCMKNNKEQPLLCSKEVMDFRTCISNTRFNQQEAKA